MEPPTVVPIARSGLKVQWLAAALVAIALGAVGVPWLQREAPRAPGKAIAVARDPRGSHRPASGAQAEDLRPPRAAESFIEPAQAAHAAYAGGDYAAALAQYHAAVERTPKDADAWSNLGQVLVRLDRIDEAITCFNRALDLVPDRWTYHFNLARAQGLLEHWDEAIAGYTRAAELFPNDYVTHFNLGLALHKHGDDAGAVEAYLKAVALAPTDAPFRMALGISYERLHKPADAVAAYAEYLRLSPGAADADKVRGHVAALTLPPAGG